MRLKNVKRRSYNGLDDHLGVSEKTIRESVEAGLSFHCYTVAPSSFPTFAKGAVTAYICQMLYLRLAKEPKPWQKKEVKRFPRIERADGEVALAFAKGDENTGQPNRRPRTVARKGPMMEKVIRLNCRQLHFREVDALAWPSDWPREIWLLLYHFAPDGSRRCELSLPTAMGRDRRVNGFAERIIIEDGSAEAIDVTETEDEEFQFDVSEKDVSQKIG